MTSLSHFTPSKLEKSPMNHIRIRTATTFGRSVSIMAKRHVSTYWNSYNEPYGDTSGDGNGSLTVVI